MSEPSSVGPEKTVPAKEPVSPARNIVGIIILAGVLVYGWFEISAKMAFSSAVAALKTRADDESKDLMTVQEAEMLLGKAADGPPVDFQDGLWHYTLKTYTWPGLLKRYTLTAYYTTAKDPRLHHYETEGTKVELPSSQKPPLISTKKKSGGSASKGETGQSSNPPAVSAPQPKIVPDSTSEPSGSSDKAAAPKPAAPEGESPKEKPAAPSDKESTPKPATGPPGAKPSQ